MTPAQQQIFAEWQGLLQEAAGQLQALTREAGAGCLQVIAQNPTNTAPLSNALGAISQQAQEIRARGGRAISPFYERLCAVGPGDPAHDDLRRSLRDFDRWAGETWARFELQIRMESYRVMWPHVQAAMQKPVTCSRCGAPLPRARPTQSESIACAACQAVNQVTPDGIVGAYFGGVPHYYADQQSMEKRFAIDRFKDDWETEREAVKNRSGAWPDEPLERLQRREAMEKDYWTTYATTKVHYEQGTPDDVKSLVEARMKQAFYDEVNLNDVWRNAHGMQTVSAQVSIPPHLENVDEWGPLHPQQNPNALEDNFVHDVLCNEAMRDPPRYQAVLEQLGYREPLHRALVQRTFLRHYAGYLSSPEGQGVVGRAAIRAMNERGAMAIAAGKSSGLLDPIEGVSLAVYGGLQARQPNLKPEQFMAELAQHQMDQAKWERVQKGFIDRMSKDTTGAVATEYAKAFMGAGQGQFGAAGQATANALGAGGMGTGAVEGAEPVSFDRYCEISGAMSAWSKQGKDISVGLDKSFQMTAMDVSNISMYWSTQMMQDFSMFDKQSQLVSQYEQKYLQMP